MTTQPDGAQPQPQQPQVIQPAPLPTSWTVQPLVTDQGQQIVAIQVNTPAGTGIYFLAPDGALQVAAQIQQVADQARTGLILPPNNGLRP